MVNYNETVRSLLFFGLIKKVLEDVRDNGIEDRALYFTIFTNYPGVQLPDFCKYEETFTIILEYEFWDLTVTTSGFFVSLIFEEDEDEEKNRVFIPFESIGIFADPNYDFWIRFDHTLPLPEEDFSEDNPAIRKVNNIIKVDFKKFDV